MRKFLDEVEPERVLSEPERNRRAEAAKKAHFARLAFLSAKARAKATRWPAWQARMDSPTARWVLPVPA